MWYLIFSCNSWTKTHQSLRLREQSKVLSVKKTQLYSQRMPCMLNNSRKLFSKWQHFEYYILNRTGGEEKRSTRAFFSPYTKWYNHIKICRIRNNKPDHSMHNTGYIWNSSCDWSCSPKSWTGPCLALAQTAAAVLWLSFCPGDPRGYESYAVMTFRNKDLPSCSSLPSYSNHVSTQQDKLTELRNILQNTISEAAKLCILGEEKKREIIS